MIYRQPKTFRNTAFAVTAAAAIAGASVLATFPANAQQAVAVNQCTTLKKNSEEHMKCMLNAMDQQIADTKKHTEQMKRVGEQAKREGDEALAIAACFKYLTAGVKNGDFKKDEIVAKAGGKLNDQNVCNVATQYYGYGRKAEAGISRVQPN